MKTVGVAMSVYNAASTVSQALTSVAAQTRQPDMVVVVDDGSTDGTLQEVDKWRGLLPLEIIRHETNLGVTAGRTAAVSRLRTDLVVSLDGDDVWLPHHLSLLIQAYDERPGIVSPMAVAWRPGSSKPISWQERLQRAPKPGERDLAHLLVDNWIFTGSLFERAAYEAAGGSYRHHLSEDWDLWIRLLAGDAPVTVLEEPTVLYRVHQGSLSADDGTLPEEVRVLETFLEENSDPGFVAAARRSLRHRVGRLALREAYHHAGGGQRSAARLAAVKALRGPAGVRRRAVAMIVAPRLTAAWRNRVRSASAS